MSVSGVYSWPLTAGELITASLQKIGAYAANETPEGEDMETGQTLLNAMLHSWAIKGNLWRDALGDVTVMAGSTSVAAPAGARSINSVRYVQSATNKRQLAQWNRDQYMMLPYRDQSSSSGPSIWYSQKTLDGITLYLWPVCSTAITLEVDYGAGVQTVTDQAETLDLPEEWQEAVIYGLASRLAEDLGATRIDPATVQRIDVRAGVLYQSLLDSDRPDSYYFEPDC